jgi:hypothetical protein
VKLATTTHLPASSVVASSTRMVQTHVLYATCESNSATHIQELKDIMGLRLRCPHQPSRSFDLISDGLDMG